VDGEDADLAEATVFSVQIKIIEAAVDNKAAAAAAVG